MSSVVGRKHDLLPKASQKDRGSNVPFFAEAGEEESKEDRISYEFPSIVAEMASVVSFRLDSFVESIVLCVDDALGRRVG
jgi:hypothetical protein